MGLGLGQNGHDFSNGMVHIHGGTVTLPREVRTIPANRDMEGADNGRTGSAFAPNCNKPRSHWAN
jgi:hypothetical protein